MINYLTMLWRKMFNPLTLWESAKKELEEAERNRLEAQSAQEYAAALVAYHNARITRLKMYLNQGGQL